MCADNAGESYREYRTRLSRDLHGMGWRDPSPMYLCEQLMCTASFWVMDNWKGSSMLLPCDTCYEDAPKWSAVIFWNRKYLLRFIF